MRPFYELRQSDFSVKNNHSDVSFSSHIHSDIEILYVKNGEQNVSIDGIEYKVSAGDAMIVLPNTVHEYIRENGNEKPAEEVLIICSERFYRTFSEDMTGFVAQNPIIRKSEMPPDAKYSFESIKSSSDKDLQAAWIVIILKNLLYSIQLKKTKHIPIDNISMKVMNYISDNFAEPITLDSLAKEFNVSRNYISRIFSDKLRINFRRYLDMVRAEYASSLIRTSNETITAISEASGFQSLRTFNRVFSEIYGMPPSSFRKSIDKFSKS